MTVSCSANLSLLDLEGEGSELLPRKGCRLVICPQKTLLLRGGLRSPCDGKLFDFSKFLGGESPFRTLEVCRLSAGHPPGEMK